VSTWSWKLDPTQGYSDKGVYNLLTHDDQQVQAPFMEIIWNKAVPLKVLLLAWRLLKNRLLIKDNLARRGVLHLRSMLCSGGCGMEESVNHLFLNCKHFT